MRVFYLSLALAAAVVLIQQSSALENLVVPGHSAEPGTASFERTPQGRAEAAVSDQTLETLVRATMLEVIESNNRLPRAQTLRLRLARSEPQTKVDKPISGGGVSVVVRGARVAIFCQRPNGYRCAALDVRSRRRATAIGKTLAAAQNQAAAGLRSGENSTEQGAGAAQQVLDQARQLPHTQR
jgi:hypothetical protein